MKNFTRICEFCGQEFESKSKLKRFCDRQHYATCCICGAKIEVPKNNVSYYFARLDRVTCGGKCTHELSVKTSGLSPEEHAERIRQGMIKKYGVINPGQLQSVIEKREETSLKKYGVRHASQSAQAVRKRKETCLARYGSEYVMQSDEFKEKSKQTCREKYGKDYYIQTEEMQEKIVAASRERYGTDRPSQSEEVKAKTRQTNLQRYGADHIMKTDEGVHRMREGVASKHEGNPCFNNSEKARMTNLSRYGKDWYTQTEEYRNQIRKTSLQKYGVSHWLKLPEIIKKQQETNIERYGAANVFASAEIIRRCKETLLRKYGVINPSQFEEFRKKAARNARNSKLEERICSLFTNYDIDFVHHYHISDPGNTIYHEYDFYLPKYKLLIDADGVYFHSYLSDPDGKHSLDYYDDIRVSLVPPDHMFHVIVEGNEDQQVKQLVAILRDIDDEIFNYDSYLFNWCRSIDFPYPSYAEKRLIGDWTSLCKYQNPSYVQTCRIGESIIKQFHRSIYSCHVGKNMSPIDAWYDDDMLKKVIENRLIYVNDVDPSKILRGFNVSKTCPVVSMFNPILAKYLTMKYLSEFSSVFDPFSGFSGRMLGVTSACKKYIGQDLNATAVEESSRIIDFLNLQDRADIQVQDVLASTGEYECLLTCPPYGSKEIYADETVFQSCDDWIDECLRRFRCKRYVFVVDESEKYADCIKEVLKSTSHFATVQEKVIVIDR